MNTLNKLFCVSLFDFALLLASCGTTDNRLFAVERNEMYGFVNAKGDTVINCKYNLCFTDTIERIGFVGNEKGQIECFNNKGEFLFYVFNYDNGPDYPQEGYFRILDKNGLFGYADSLGNVVIKPQYRFAYPFEDGKAKVTNSGKKVKAGAGGDDHWTWASDNWFFITPKGNKTTDK